MKKLEFYFLVLIVCVIGIAIYYQLAQGYSWSEMDWNQDGHTIVGEFFRSSETGKRVYMIDGKTCYEYFSYKDGLIIKRVYVDNASSK